jgi:hypothetical protein
MTAAHFHDDFVDRAIANWFRAGGREQPSNSSGVIRIEGRDYVRLVNVAGLLAVYLIDTAGRLKRLRQWPMQLDE